MADQIMIVVGAPPEHVDALLDAIASAGGGIIGDYTHCAFTSKGQGQFKPGGAATPHIGTKQAVNKVEEIQIQTFCTRAKAKAVARAIREAHPYEEPVFYLIPVLSEDDL